MRFLLIVAGAIGLVVGLAIMLEWAMSDVPLKNQTFAGMGITIASSVLLAAGMATVDIVSAFREKRG